MTMATRYSLMDARPLVFLKQVGLKHNKLWQEECKGQSLHRSVEMDYEFKEKAAMMESQEMELDVSQIVQVQLTDICVLVELLCQPQVAYQYVEIIGWFKESNARMVTLSTLMVAQALAKKKLAGPSLQLLILLDKQLPSQLRSAVIV